MNQELWDNILQFDFDNPPSEYGFSTRLASENFWTIDFTQRAIIEYKKFMYLAATSDFMVSPSEIVDTVWHQHLIFTQLYQDFCALIGKQIQHVPSTHNKEDFQKFKQAKDRTTKFYSNTFGNQPKDIWDFSGMFESLNLVKAKFKIRTGIIIGILIFIVLIFPCYLLLKPIYVNIDNPYFVLGFILLSFVIFCGLEIFNRYNIQRITELFDENSFIYKLQPFELVYLKTQTLSKVINGVVNELINNGSIKVNSDNTVELVKSNLTKSKEQLQTISMLNELGNTFYPTLVSQLARKPIFWNTANCMDAFNKYFNKSKKFADLFYLNFGILSLLLIFGIIRLTTGILRDVPFVHIAISTFVLSGLIIVYLIRLTKIMSTQTIPNLYKTKIIPTRGLANDWQWSYFLFGTAALSTSFAPLVNNADKYKSGEGSYVSSCVSSCGSSCSSCGGCGGD